MTATSTTSGRRVQVRDSTRRPDEGLSFYQLKQKEDTYLSNLSSVNYVQNSISQQYRTAFSNFALLIFSASVLRTSVHYTPKGLYLKHLILTRIFKKHRSYCKYYVLLLLYNILGKAHAEHSKYCISKVL